jgi:hypothetical protein
MPAFRPPAPRPWASFALAALALFVALGGPAEAQRLLSGSDIKKGTITSKQVKDGSLQAVDLARKARRSLTHTPAGSITDAKLGDGAVTSRSLAPASVLSGAVADSTLTADDLAANAVGTEELGDNAVGQAEIRNNGVGASEIVNDAIDGGEIVDGGLLARDIARFSGVLEARFPDFPPDDCVTARVTGTAADTADADISADLILVSADVNWPEALSYHVRGGAGEDRDKFFLTACNATAGTVDTPAVAFFRYAVIGI